MKWISNELARVTHTMNQDEIRPLGGMYVPEMLRLVAERYGFNQAPTPDQVAKTGALFHHGRLIAGSKKIMILELAIYSDGMKVAAQDTDSAEFVLEDAISWARDALGLRPELSKQPRRYENSAVVDFEQPIEKGLVAFKSLQSALQGMLRSLYDYDPIMEPSRLYFSVDPTHRQIPLTDFIIERRTNVPYSSNRFFSSAPVRTEMHVDLLQGLENALAKL